MCNQKLLHSFCKTVLIRQQLDIYRLERLPTRTSPVVAGGGQAGYLIDINSLVGKETGPNVKLLSSLKY